MMRKIKRTPDDLDELLERDREDEIPVEEFTEEDYAFLEELREMEKDFN
jgi:hypothetical protein